MVGNSVGIFIRKLLLTVIKTRILNLSAPLHLIYHTNALNPVIDRPTMSELISFVPS